jgi:hypothetical protein
MRTDNMYATTTADRSTALNTAILTGVLEKYDATPVVLYGFCVAVIVPVVGGIGVPSDFTG